MAPHSVPRLLRAVLTLAGVSALAVSVPVAAHADPATSTDLQAKIDQNTRDLAQAVKDFDLARAELTGTKVIADTVAAKLSPLDLPAPPRASSLIDQVTPGNRMPLADSVRDMTEARTELAAEKSRLEGLIATQMQREQELGTKKSGLEATARQLKAEKDAAAERTAEQQRQQQTASRSSSTPRTTSAQPSNVTPPSVSGKAGVAVQFAYAQLGKPYVFGAAGPGSYDCSGLTMAAWGAAGVGIGGHQTNAQWAATTRISRSQLQPGDLVFMYGLGHVGIYVGSNQVIHAPQPGESVKITSIDAFGSYDGAGRVRA